MQRYEQLDSLRGLAALTVLIGHFMIVIPNMLEYTYGQDKFWLMNLFKYTPLYFIRTGHEAVFLFFVLSGFVLSLQFYKGGKINYKDFVIKRFFRIYIPYITSIATALLLINLLTPNGIPSLSTWFNSIWNEPITLKMLIKYIVMVTGVDPSATNTVVWSLVYEMDISLVFPFFMFFLLRVNEKILFPGIFLIVIMINLIVPSTTIANLALYSFMFICGALLAKHRNEAKTFYNNLTLLQKSFFVGLASFLYMYGIFMVDHNMLHGFIVDELVITFGALLFVMFSLSSATVIKLLTIKPILYLGKISYSLYLYHTIVLFSFIYMFYYTLPLWVIWTISFIGTIGISSLSYHFIEKPSIKIGKTISSKRKSYIPETKKSA